ncbi:PRTRC system protein E [Paraburkholderia sp. GAS82]|uniref:PRTRC system protein E n=1 Tax=Paraburkholderia sp. GAS82 TaxID=3035137 RepID=UPI003D20A485
MTLFKSLFPLARDNSLTILIVGEGDQLRVNVMPKSKDEKSEKTLYPLSLLGTPDELDSDFAEAVQIYSPGSQSVLDQARAASAANAPEGAKPALPAPAKGKPGRKPRTPALPAPAADAASTAEAEAPDEGDTPAVDPRQTQIPGLDNSEGEAPPDEQESPADPVAEEPAASDATDDGAVDLL